MYKARGTPPVTPSSWQPRPGTGRTPAEHQPGTHKRDTLRANLLILLMMQLIRYQLQVLFRCDCGLFSLFIERCLIKHEYLSFIGFFIINTRPTVHLK